jgi:hypothetical protein
LLKDRRAISYLRQRKKKAESRNDHQGNQRRRTEAARCRADQNIQLSNCEVSVSRISDEQAMNHEPGARTG